MSTKKRWPPYKKSKSINYEITKFILPPDTHSKYTTAKEDFEAFSRALRGHLVKDTTISPSKIPKSHVKLATHMHYDNGFELIIAIDFSMIPQLRGIRAKYQDLMILFRLGEGESPEVN